MFSQHNNPFVDVQYLAAANDPFAGCEVPSANDAASDAGAITAVQALKAAFGKDAPRAHVAIFHKDPDEATGVEWNGRPAGDLEQLELLTMANANGILPGIFFSMSMFKGHRRVADDFEYCPLLGIDDVGEKVGKNGVKVAASDLLDMWGEPTWAQSTSPGKEHWFYIFTEPCRDRAKVELLCHAVGSDAKAVTSYRRLSGGANHKAKYNCGPMGFVNVVRPGSDLNRRFDIENMIAALPPVRLATAQAKTKGNSAACAAWTGAPVAVYRLAEKLGLLLGPSNWHGKPGARLIQCPGERGGEADGGWIGATQGHTDVRDDDTAALCPDGAFKCHHGTCDGRTGRGDLWGWLCREAKERGEAHLIDEAKNEETAAGFDTIPQGEEGDDEYSWDNPDLSLLEDTRGPLPACPLDVLPPSWAQWSIEAAEGSGAPVDYVVLALLCAVAGVCGVHVKVLGSTNWAEPSILWGGLVGVPSIGKTPAISIVMRVVHEVEKLMQRGDDARRLAHEQELVQRTAARDAYKKLLKSLAPGKPIPPMPAAATASVSSLFIPTQVITNDPTIEALVDVLSGNQRGVLLYRNELPAWLEGMSRYSNSSEASAYLEAYDGKPLTTNRRNRGGRLSINAFAVSVLGGIQPDKIAEMLYKAHDGMVPRFLTVWPDEAPLVLPSEQKPADIDVAVQRLHAIATWADVPRMLRFADKAAIDEWDHRVKEAKARSRLLDGFAQEWNGKYGVVLRLAGMLTLLAASESPQGLTAPAITVDVLRAAWKLWDGYFRAHADAVFRIGGGTRRWRLLKKVVRGLRTMGKVEVGVQDIRRDILNHRLDETDVQQVVISSLDRMGLLRKAVLPHTSSLGRKAHRWDVNPRLLP
jgi:hypothetical protein